jgi:iduronate 2-sulfatase
VLFFAVDDMRPNIGAYNHSLAHTPNMDQLAATGLTFHRA